MAQQKQPQKAAPFSSLESSPHGSPSGPPHRRLPGKDRMQPQQTETCGPYLAGRRAWLTLPGGWRGTVQGAVTHSWALGVPGGRRTSSGCAQSCQGCSLWWMEDANADYIVTGKNVFLGCREGILPLTTMDCPQSPGGTLVGRLVTCSYPNDPRPGRGELSRGPCSAAHSDRQRPQEHPPVGNHGPSPSREGRRIHESPQCSEGRGGFLRCSTEVKHFLWGDHQPGAQETSCPRFMKFCLLNPESGNFFTFWSLI